MGAVCCYQDALQPVACCEALMEEWRGHDSMFLITVERRDNRIGLDVDLTCGDVLPVLRINCGPVEEWNRKRPQHNVVVGDIIVKVNGVEGDAEAMMERLKCDDRLQITILRERVRKVGNLWPRSAEKDFHYRTEKLASDPRRDPDADLVAELDLNATRGRSPACVMCGVNSSGCMVPWLASPPSDRRHPGLVS
mmetsp:Transcript_168924/g.543061  ORF Transcript_168924/g.543061 Transcript_168924/m.543061 type:complete len:194 (+) Transcript_168924:114-695(+)